MAGVINGSVRVLIADDKADIRSVVATRLRIEPAFDVVGEAVLYHRRLEHALGDPLSDGRQASEELDMGEQLLDELQDSVIQMRTLPLSTITASYPRAIRDLATAEKKKVATTLLDPSDGEAVVGSRTVKHSDSVAPAARVRSPG